MAAMFEFEIVSDLTGETTAVAAGMRDVRMWEKTFPRRSFGQLTDKSNFSATVMYEIAFTAARRRGVVDGGLTLEQFVERYDLAVTGDEPEPGAAPATLPDEPDFTSPAV